MYPGQLATLGDQHESIDGGDSKGMYSLTAVDLAIASSLARPSKIVLETRWQHRQQKRGIPKDMFLCARFGNLKK